MRDGIHRKYSVTRTDGSSAPGGKHERCAYFVLDLEHDEFAVPALKAYAKACRKTHPDLAFDIGAIVQQHEARLAVRCHCREASCPHSIGHAFVKTASDTAHDLMNRNKR